MVIQRMRDGSEGILAKVIIGLIIIVFGLFGFGSITTFLAPIPKVATVNGEDITQTEMEVAVERSRSRLLSEGASLDQIDEDELRTDTLDRLISRELLTQAVADLNFGYSDEAIDADIRDTEFFQANGVYDPGVFQNALRNAGYTPLGYRDVLRQDKLLEQLLTAVQMSSFMTEAESRHYSSLFSQSRDMAFVEIKSEDLLDEVVLEDEEIQAHYNAHISDFATEEKVELTYLELKRADLAADLDVDEEALALYFEDVRGDYSEDETRRIAHILVEVTDELPADEAREKADELLARLEEGEDFAALAEEVSDDAGSRASGGDLGFNPRGVFYPEFETVAWELPKDQLSEPVKTESGWHVIKVLDIEEAVVPELADVRAEVEQSYRLSETEEDFISMSARLAELLFESADLTDPADELGLEVQTTGYLTRDASHFLMSNEEVAEAAFSPDVLLDGNNSDLIELFDDHHLGIRVQEHQPSVTRPLAEVTEEIRSLLRDQKATRLAEERADKIIAAIEDGFKADQVAEEYALSWQSFSDITREDTEIDPLILQAAFQLPRPVEDQETLGAEALSGRVVVLRISGVENKPLEDLDETEVSALRQGLASQQGLAEFQGLESSLTELADIERLN